MKSQKHTKNIKANGEIAMEQMREMKKKKCRPMPNE